MTYAIETRTKPEKANRRFPCPGCGKEFSSAGMAGHARACTASYADRFWAKVDKSAGPDGCWLYMGYRKRHNYGWLWTERGLMTGHRYAWLLTHGSLPADKDILHKCDNGPCCNPAHLWAGTHKENMQDAMRKRRHAHGSRSIHAKLNEDQVREIRAAWRTNGKRGAAGKSNARELGKKYGVEPGTIYLVATGRTWAYVK